MARVIVLDAGVLIALNARDDAHHSQVVRFFDSNAGERFAAGAITLAESLVHAVAAGVAEALLEDYEALGIEPFDVPGEAAGTVARIRAETRLRLPDVLVLYACEREHAELATTDIRLAQVAADRGIRTHRLTRV
jgi:predicted nucleic acid-binding protein